MKKIIRLCFHISVIYYTTTSIQNLFAQEFTVHHIFNEGIDQFNAGNFSAAVLAFDHVIVLSDTFKAAWYNRGLSKLNLRDLMGAEQDFKTLHSIEPYSTRSLKFLGYIEMKLHKPEASIYYYTKAISIDSLDHESFLNRGIMKFHKKIFPEALQDLNQSLNLKSDQPIAHYYQGLININLKRYTSAVENFTTAMALNPEHTAYLLNRANAYIHLHQYESALLDVEQYRLKDPENEYALRTKKFAMQKLNIQKQGTRILDSLLTRNPDNRSIIRERALYKINNKDYEGGLVDIKSIEKLYPTDTELKYAKGLGLFYTNLYTEALQSFDRLIDLDNKHGWAYYYRAITKSNLEIYKTKEVCKDLKQAATLGVIEATMAAKDHKCKKKV